MAVLTVCMMIETVITVGGECLKGVDKGMKASRGAGDGARHSASATRALRREDVVGKWARLRAGGEGLGFRRALAQGTIK